MKLKNIIAGAAIAGTILTTNVEAKNCLYVATQTDNGIEYGIEITKELGDCEFGSKVIQSKDLTNSELGLGIILKKDVKDYTLRLSTGMNILYQKEPLKLIQGSHGDVPVSELTQFVEFGIDKKLIDRLNLKLSYRKNLAEEEVFNNNYSKDKFSLGLEWNFSKPKK